MIEGYYIQDTIRQQLDIRINPDKLLPDLVFRRLDEVPAHIRYADSLSKIRRGPRLPEVSITDTTSVCLRNSLADATFYDSLSFVRNLDLLPPVFYPYRFEERPLRVNQEQSTIMVSSLRDGIDLPKMPLQHDWLIGILFLAAYLWLIVRTTTRSILPEIARFIVFRGINESSSSDIGSIFTWQSTIMNFISFTVIGLFLFCTAEWYDFIPSGISPPLFMIISTGSVIFAITSRHFICLAAGNLSGESEAFNEYLMNVYQSYRYSSFFVFAAVILLLYTDILPSQVFLAIGVIILIIFYLLRIFRLFLIFIRKNISVLYLILYLCALEILPAMILVKYFTGLDL